MPAVFHRDKTTATPMPGVARLIAVDREDGAGAISMGYVEVEPGGVIVPHTHPVEEAITILEGHAVFLVGEQRVEIDNERATVLAPGNTVHAMRNVGETVVRLVIAYPSVNVPATRVSVEF